MAACKTKQLIARTYGKQRKKKNKLKPVVYGIYVEEAEPVGDAMQYSMLTQFAVSIDIQASVLRWPRWRTSNVGLVTGDSAGQPTDHLHCPCNQAVT